MDMEEKMKKLSIISIILSLVLFAGSGTAWSITSLPILTYSGDATSTNDGSFVTLTLDSNTLIDTAYYLDNSSTNANNSEESVIDATLSLTIATPAAACSDFAPAVPFSLATVTITGPDSFVYMTADLEVLMLNAGTFWLLFPPALDANDPATLKLSNVQLFSDMTHPSRWADEFIAALNSFPTDIAGMTMVLTTTSGNLCAGGTFNVQGVVDGAPEYTPMPLDTATLQGTVFSDLNNNGIQDPGEEGLGSISVLITGDVYGNGIETIEVVTDENGFYSLEVEAGMFTVAVDNEYADLPTGTFLSTVISQTVIVEGGDTADINFGFAPSSTLGDTVFEDLNANGIQDPGETGILGVEVTVTGDLDNDGDTDIAHTTTDVNGNYTFLVAPGAYTVSVNEGTLPSASYINTTPGILTDSVVFGENNLNFDFGFIHIGNPINQCDGRVKQLGVLTRGAADLPVTITARTIDSHDGVLGEISFVYDGTFVTPVSDGVVSIVNVFIEDGLINVVTNTDAANLPDGKLGPNTIFEVEIGTTTNSQAIHTSCSQPLGVGMIFGEFTVVSMTTGTGQPTNGKGAISGTVFKDNNANGVQESGENGISRVSVNLYLDDGDGIFNSALDTLDKTSKTNKKGNYRFKKLVSGTYFVQVDESDTDLPSGYFGTTFNPLVIELGPNEVVSGVDFGFAPPIMLSSISGAVFEDDNNNGVRDGKGERGIDKVDVDLYLDNGDGVFDPATDTYIETMRTKKKGEYKFRALAAGTYFVDVDETDPDIPFNSTMSNTEPVVVLDNGQKAEKINVGFHYPESGCSGGVKELGLLTGSSSYSLPATITFQAKDHKGKLRGSVSLIYNGDPITQVSDGIVTVVDVIESGGELNVETYIDASSFNSNKLSCQTMFEVSINDEVNSEEIQTSCSYYHPVAIGMVFDKFTVTSVESP